MATIGRKSVLIIIAFVIFLLIALTKVFYLTNEDFVQVVSERPISSSEKVSAPALGDIGQATTPPKSKHESSSDYKENVDIDEADWYKFQLWKRERGYPQPEDEVIYSEYDVAVLLSMAESGDIFAIQELGSRAYNLELGGTTATSVDFALTAYKDAAARGSTYALTLIGDHKLANVGMENNDQKRAEMVVSGLAWYRAAVMRGDVAVEQTHIKTFREINNVSLSEDLENRIVFKAEEILEGLQAKRLELGLGEYDNSTSNVAELLNQ